MNGRLSNGLTPEQDAAFDALTDALVAYYRAEHKVAYENGAAITCSCGTVLRNHGTTHDLADLFGRHIQEAKMEDQS